MASETEAVIEERKREREGRFHQVNLQDVGTNSPSPQEVYESMLEDIVKTNLKEGSKEMLKNLLTRDFVLANLTKAELNEFKWKLRVKKEIFYAMHPDEHCKITGDVRAFVNDDPTDRLEPLSDMQRWEVENVFDGIWMRVTRSLNAMQWDAMNTDIRESRVRGDQGESGSGGIVGKILRR